MKKKLMIVVNTSKFFMTHRLLLAKGAVKNNFYVIVVCPNGPEVVEIKKQGFEVQLINISRMSLNPIKEFFSLLSFFKIIKKHRPDVYHGFTIKPVLYGALCSRLLKVENIVVTITGLGYIFLNKSFFRKTLKAMMIVLYKIILKTKNIKVIFQNEDDKELFVNNGWIYPEQSLIVYGTGVDTLRFSPGSNLNNKVVIIFPARFLVDKGINELVKACESIYKQQQNFELHLCGDIDSGNRSSITKLELDNLVKLPFINFNGFKKDMSKVYKNADIVCLPSYREGIPLALIEAASSGLPIVTTDVPGCRETVIHEKNGFLVPALNTKALEEPLLKLINSKELRNSMGAEGRKLALNQFEASHVIEENLKTYKKAA